ncbi:MAG: hypothetical protein N4A44_02410 [Alphaproteobacteria bacterium]|jgi:hypothetical protein|nr:hypothetical protein [Alphaproteobacteria bacterium]
MKKYFLMLFFILCSITISTPAFSAPGDNPGLTNAVYNQDYSQTSAQDSNMKPIKALDRLMIRLTELFNMAREVIYILSAFVLLSYLWKWVQKGSMDKEDFKTLAWFMVALAILGMARSFAEFAVGGEVDFINQIEERYYNETGERIVIMGNSIK